MTDFDTPQAEQQDTNSGSTENAGAAILGVAGLIKELFGKLADAQVAVLQARLGRDLPATDRAMLQLRATALLLASIPAPSLDAMRHKVIAAAVLRAEDDDVSSLAWRMVEFAIRQDDVRLQGRPW